VAAPVCGYPVLPSCEIRALTRGIASSFYIWIHRGAAIDNGPLPGAQGRGYGEAGGEGLFSSRQISESLTHPPRRVPHPLPRRPGTALRQAHGSTLPFHKLTALSRVEGLTLLERSRREGAERSRSVVNRYFAVRPKCTNASGHSRGCPYFTSSGRDRLNSEPSPGLLFTDTSPSWARRISRVMASPMPAPMAFRSAPGPR